MWCGTESGRPIQDVGGGPIWSTGGGHFGDANGTDWMPKFCDPQLFQEHVWFWEGEQKMMIFGIKNEELSIKTRNFVFRMMNFAANLKVRSLGMMIPIYHDIVGRGMVMELAFSIDRDGLVEDTHAVVCLLQGICIGNLDPKSGANCAVLFLYIFTGPGTSS